jgi:DNA repair protein RadC
MQTSRERIRRSKNALQQVLEFLYPKDPGLTDRLIRHFGTAGAVIEAGKYQLMQHGISESNALLIGMLPGIIRHMEKQRFGPHPKLSTLVAAEDYMSMRYIGESIERFYMLALDNSGKLLECVHVQSGNEDSAPFYLKHVMAEVVRTRARAIVIIHNHPNQTPRPSQGDLDCTRQLMEALTAVDIPLVDHMIMIEKRAMSVRGFGFIPEYQWMAQAPENKLLRGWLAGWDMDEAAKALSPRGK